jgi:protein-tyrosine phosphatase
MAISKVIYAGRTLVDLTSDTVDAAHLVKGYTAHGADGEAVTGTHEEAWSTGVAEYDQQTAAVTAYLAATSDYTDANRATTSHADLLPSGGDTCAGLDIAAPDGTAKVVVTREDGSEGAATYAPSGGKATIYNLAPGATYSYRCMAKDGSLLAGGLVRAKAGVRLLRMASLRNVRDLGGWACDGGTVRHGLLLRGPAPESAPAADVAELHDRMRVRIEVDLRGSDEVPYTTSAIGSDVEYRDIDVPWYGDGLRKDEHIPDYAEAVRTCMRAAAYGTTTYIHCSAGADRTAMICAMLEAVLGVSEADIDRDYELTCLSGSDRRRTRADWTGFVAKMHGAYPSASLTAATIAWLVKTGGVDNALVNLFRSNASTGGAGEVNVARITKQPKDVTVKPGEDVEESVDASGDGLTYLWEFRTSASGAWASVAALGMAATYDNFTIKGFAVTADVDGWQVRCTVTDSYGTSEVSKTATLHVVTTYYFVSQKLSHATSSNSATSVDKNGSYSATITPDTGYATPTITVTMGGADITSSAVSGSTISIASVTGDVVITATAARLSNLIAISTDAAGNTFGTNGIKSGARLGSGGESASNVHTVYADGTIDTISCTGFMPIELGKRINFEHCNLIYNTSGVNAWPVYVMFYDESHNHIGATGTPPEYFANRKNFKPSTADWGGKAIAKVADVTFSGQFRELLSMTIDAADSAITSAAKYVRISAYGLGPDSRVWLTDE